MFIVLFSQKNNVKRKQKILNKRRRKEKLENVLLISWYFNYLFWIKEPMTKNCTTGWHGKDYDENAFFFLFCLRLRGKGKSNFYKIKVKQKIIFKKNLDFKKNSQF